ncbi:MAG: right-handed parallel beta-helix repeat-containing protein, partial [Planctomycetota bacterium]
SAESEAADQPAGPEATPVAEAPVVEAEPVVEPEPVVEGEPVEEAEAEAGPVVEADGIDEADTDGAALVIEVGSMQEFLFALGPNRTLQLAADVEYRVGMAERGVSDHYQWREVMDGQYQLIIRNCEGLTIRGPLGEMATIVTQHPYATVLQFDRCPGLTLENLEIGHDPTEGFCIGAVVGLTDCADVFIGDCILFGSGTEGLKMENVADLTVSASVITECTYRILTANNCRQLTFIDCQFVDNEQYGGLNFTDTVDVRLIGCAIEDNLVSEYGGGLFSTNLTSDEARIVIRGGRIEGNDAPQLCDPAGMVTAKDVSIVNNTWQN